MAYSLLFWRSPHKSLGPSFSIRRNFQTICCCCPSSLLLSLSQSPSFPNVSPGFFFIYIPPCFVCYSIRNEMPPRIEANMAYFTFLRLKVSPSTTILIVLLPPLSFFPPLSFPLSHPPFRTRSLSRRFRRSSDIPGSLYEPDRPSRRGHNCALSQSTLPSRQLERWKKRTVPQMHLTYLAWTDRFPVERQICHYRIFSTVRFSLSLSGSCGFPPSFFGSRSLLPVPLGRSLFPSIAAFFICAADCLIVFRVRRFHDPTNDCPIIHNYCLLVGRCGSQIPPLLLSRHRAFLSVDLRRKISGACSVSREKHRSSSSAVPPADRTQ